MSLPVLADIPALLLAGVPLMDVRAPVEFGRGAVPGACNLPLMNDEERARVGRLYKEEGQQAAIALGHELVAGERKAARLTAWATFARRHPEGALYCFRGGLRSQITQRWLAQETGLVYPRVHGGYKAMRSYLLAELTRLSTCASLTVLGGMTGTGKTELLQTLKNALDLEGYARHRGSSFGRHLESQPGQIDFEHALTVDWLQRQASGIAHYVIEDEARIIGHCHLPLILYQRMQASPMVWLEDSMANRVQRILDLYVTSLSADFVCLAGVDAGLAQFSARLRGSLDRIAKRLGGERYRRLAAIMDEALLAQCRGEGVEAHRIWIQALLREYYDPMYDYQRRQQAARILFTGTPLEVRDWLLRQPT